MQAHAVQPMQQRHLLIAAAFPHNVWRACSAFHMQQIKVSRVPDTCSRRQQHHSMCRAAQPQQPDRSGEIGQQGAGYGQQQQAAAAYRSQDDIPNIHLPNLTPPIPPRPPPVLSWLPPQLLTHLQALLGFLKACWALLPEFVSPSLSEACRRLCLVLGASLVMVVLVSTIDSGWLYLYLLNARRVAA